VPAAGLKRTPQPHRCRRRCHGLSGTPHRVRAIARRGIELLRVVLRRGGECREPLNFFTLPTRVADKDLSIGKCGWLKRYVPGREIKDSPREKSNEGCESFLDSPQSIDYGTASVHDLPTLCGVFSGCGERVNLAQPAPEDATFCLPQESIRQKLTVHISRLPKPSRPMRADSAVAAT
jgi:hypothetical protein